MAVAEVMSAEESNSPHAWHAMAEAVMALTTACQAQGDFVVMANETTHPAIHSVHGNLLLIVAGHNEFVHA